MPETIREQVLQAFADKVNAERTLRLESDSELPVKSVWDNGESATKTKFGCTSVEMPLTLEYLATVDSSTYPNYSKQANAMLGELIQTATENDNTLGGLSKSITYQECEISYPEEGESEIGVYAVFNITYEFANGDPFTVA